MPKITFDKRNYRIHTDKNKQLIEKSLKECGAGRSILLDNSGSIIAGNGIYEQAQKLGLDVEIIHTDGKKLIAVQRDDIAPDSQERVKMAILDNTTSDTAQMDIGLAVEDIGVETAKDLGLDVQGMDCETEMPDLASGDRQPFQTMSFSLADGQADIIKEAISVAKTSENFEYVDTMDNPNGNGNALFMIVQEWLNAKR